MTLILEPRQVEGLTDRELVRRRGRVAPDASYGAPLTREFSLPSGEGVKMSIAMEGVLAPKWLDPVLRKLIAVAQLPPDWNSYGASSITVETLARALSLLGEVAPREVPVPAVLPTPRGGIQFEWHTVIDLEVEVRPSGQVYVAYENLQTGTEWEGEATGEKARLRAALAELAGTAH